MYIKPDSSDAIAAFLAKGNKITDCGSTMKQAKSLRQMRREDDQMTSTDRFDSIERRRKQALAIEERNDQRFGSDSDLPW